MPKQIAHSLPKILIDGQQIKCVKESKMLGVTIDQHLNWKSNTEKICKKNCIWHKCPPSFERFC